MNKTTIVAILLLFSSHAVGANLPDALRDIESAWASAYYLKNADQQKTIYPELINQATTLSKQFPASTEARIWLAILLSTNAAYESPFSALSSLNQAKELLEKSISENPSALQGAAFVTLGTLYYMAPSWPVSFGDIRAAEHLLKRALEINPRGIDSNYFYGDFLVSQNRESEAEMFFRKALQAPLRQEQLLADSQLHRVAEMALRKTRKGRIAHKNNHYLTLYSKPK